MVIGIFLILVILLTITDIKEYKIPNIIVLPAIVWGMMLTGDWVWALSLFTIGACFCHEELIAGGDVKLMAMGGAFLGWIAIPAFILSRFLIRAYRKNTLWRTSLPYAPFFLISSCVIIAINGIVRWLTVSSALTAGGV